MLLSVRSLFDESTQPWSLEWDALKAQPRTFVDLLDQHKALLFSCAAADEDSDKTATCLTPDDFGQFVVDLKLTYYPYVGGAAPRSIIPVSAGKDIVFTANERYVNYVARILQLAKNQHPAGFLYDDLQHDLTFIFHPPHTRNNDNTT
jgi:hypothetical protein